jgi:hypothetical protein
MTPPHRGAGPRPAWPDGPGGAAPSGRRIGWITFYLFVVLSQLLALAVPPMAQAQSDAPDYEIARGRFYTQAGGFALEDTGGIAFYSEFLRLGGVDVLGYPVSGRWVGPDGFVYQATQGALLQWRPERAAAVLANIFELLHQAGLDEWLYQAKGVPRPIPDDGSGGDFSRARAARLAWLTQPEIRAYFLRDPATGRPWSEDAAIERYGLPMSLPERFGPFVSQRFQRVALQLWLDTVPGMPAPGSVVRVLAGDLLKEAGLIPADALRPQSPPAPLPADPLARAQAILRSEPAYVELADAFDRYRVSLTFGSLPRQLGAAFFTRGRRVVVNERYRTASPLALAALLAHEARHVLDVFSGEDVRSPEGCYAAEARAFEVQAAVWQALTGSGGKFPPADDLERHLNDVLRLRQADPERFVANLRQAYADECG